MSDRDSVDHSDEPEQQESETAKTAQADKPGPTPDAEAAGAPTAETPDPPAAAEAETVAIPIAATPDEPATVAIPKVDKPAKARKPAKAVKPAKAENPAVAAAPTPAADAETVAIPTVAAAKPEPVAAEAKTTPVAAPPEPAVTEPPTTRIPATPVRIEAAGPAGDTGRRKWYFGAAAAAAAVAALVIALVAHDRSATAGSPETQVTNAINAYVKALSTGDLATLRTVTSGNLATFYKSLSDREFADVYRTAVKQKTIPVVDSVDAVQVTGKTAIAQVTAYTPDKPEKKAARNFNLQETNEGWTVTDAP